MAGKKHEFPFVEVGNEYDRALVRGEIPSYVADQIPTTESGAPPSGEEQYYLQLREEEARRRAGRSPAEWAYEELVPNANPNGSPPSVVDMALRGMSQLPPDPIMGPLGMGAGALMVGAAGPGAPFAAALAKQGLPNAMRAARRNPEMLTPIRGRPPGIGGEVGDAYDAQRSERIRRGMDAQMPSQPEIELSARDTMKSVFENDLTRTMRRLNEQPALPPPSGRPQPNTVRAPGSVATPGAGGDIAEVGVRQAAQRRQQADAFKARRGPTAEREAKQAEASATFNDVKEMADYIGRTGDSDPGTLMNVLDAYVKARVKDGASAAQVRRDVAAAIDEGGYRIDWSRYQERTKGKFGSFPTRGQNKIVEALRRRRRKKR